MEYTVSEQLQRLYFKLRHQESSPSNDHQDSA